MLHCYLTCWMGLYIENLVKNQIETVHFNQIYYNPIIPLLSPVQYNNLHIMTFHEKLPSLCVGPGIDWRPVPCLMPDGSLNRPQPPMTLSMIKHL